MEKLLGNIHSIETCGTVDGPGIRFVVFMQGCPMRCLYCHNPDSWSLDKNKTMTVDEILKKYDGVKEFCKGGITVSGGEPLLQIDFLTQLFEKADKLGIHTALDTSGIMFKPNNTEKIDHLLDHTKLVLLDIKHIDNDEHIKLTGHSNINILKFAKYLDSKNIPVWIRHVVVPTITDNKVYLEQLGKFLSELKNIQALDILPYHTMAITKYEKLEIDYQLKNIPPLSKSEAIEARNVILSKVKFAEK